MLHFSFESAIFYGDSEEVIPSAYLDMPLLQVLAGMRINLLTLAFNAGVLGRWQESFAELSKEITKGWEPAQAFFNSTDSLVKEPLGAAIEWHVDSVLDDNESVAYLKTCIGIEAILGEAKEGLTELSNRLEDRYAFMIGKNRSQRKELGDIFKRVLKTRGALVHARQRRLDKNERALLREARIILVNCIDHELTTLLPA